MAVWLRPGTVRSLREIHTPVISYASTHIVSPSRLQQWFTWKWFLCENHTIAPLEDHGSLHEMSEIFTRNSHYRPRMFDHGGLTEGVSHTSFPIKELLVGYSRENDPQSIERKINYNVLSDRVRKCFACSLVSFFYDAPLRRIFDLQRVFVTVRSGEFVSLGTFLRFV